MPLPSDRSHDFARRLLEGQQSEVFHIPTPEYLVRLRERIGNDLIVLPAVTACIFSGSGHLLLARDEAGEWTLPGGGVGPDEVPDDKVVHKVAEEVGLDVEPCGIIAVYGGPHCRSVYSNGDQVSYTIVVYGCTVVGGRVQAGGGISAARYFDADEVVEARLQSWMPPALPALFAWFDRRRR